MIQKADSLLEGVSRVDTIYFSRVDTLYIKGVDPETTQQYLDVLVNTNSQMGHWLTALGVIVATISILFTCLAIAAALFGLKLSSNFNRKLSDLISSYKRSFEDFVASKNAETEELIRRKSEDFDNQIRLKIEEKNQTDDPEKIEEIEKQIKEIETKKDTELQIVRSEAKQLLSYQKMYTCRFQDCGHEFIIDTGSWIGPTTTTATTTRFSDNPALRHALGFPPDPITIKTVICPKCKREQSI